MLAQYGRRAALRVYVDMTAPGSPPEDYIGISLPGCYQPAENVVVLGIEVNEFQGRTVMWYLRGQNFHVATVSAKGTYDRIVEPDEVPARHMAKFATW